MPEEHKIFMEEYEKYGNNCTLIAKVLNSRTPAQNEKHAECFFRQNVKTNFAVVKGYKESLSPNKKAQILITNVAEQQTINNQSHKRKKLKFYAIMLKDTENNVRIFFLRKRSKFYKLMLIHITRNGNLFT